MRKKKKCDFPTKIAKGIREPVNVYTIPEYLRKNTVIIKANPEDSSYLIKAKKVVYIDGDGHLSEAKADNLIQEIPFSGLNSNLEYVSIKGVLEKNNEKELNEIRIKIATVMDKKEIDLLKILKKRMRFQFNIFQKKRYYIFVKRYISKELAKSMGWAKKEILRVSIVCPCPVVMSDTIKGIKPNTLAYGVYGYESYIMALVEE